MSTNSLLDSVESIASRHLTNNDASTSSWMGFTEKYGRIWLSMSEMKVQNASSSGDCKRIRPAVATRPVTRPSVSKGR